VCQQRHLPHTIAAGSTLSTAAAALRAPRPLTGVAIAGAVITAATAKTATVAIDRTSLRMICSFVSRTFRSGISMPESGFGAVHLTFKPTGDLTSSKGAAEELAQPRGAPAKHVPMRPNHDAPLAAIFTSPWRGPGGERSALDWTVRCVALFSDFPHPATGPRPHQLVRLTAALGLPALEAS
jgi:hypothetical protein